MVAQTISLLRPVVSAATVRPSFLPPSVSGIENWSVANIVAERKKKHQQKRLLT